MDCAPEGANLIQLSVDNSRTRIIGADNFLLGQLDQEMRYPTDFAAPVLSGLQISSGNGGWDGWIRLFRNPKRDAPWFPTGLLPLCIEVLRKFRCQYQLFDARRKPAGGVPDATVNLGLRDYQQEAVRRALEVGRGVIDLPPRSGKTRLALEIHRQLAVPTLWLAPTDNIVRQTCDVAARFFGERYVMHAVGAASAVEAIKFPLVVCTAATAYRMPDHFYASREALIMDEFHHASAKQYQSILAQCDHVYYRFGLTGTYFRSGQDALAMYQHLSNTIFKLTTKDLVERGYLAPVQAVFLPFDAPRIRARVGGRFHGGGHGTVGISEHDARNALIGEAALQLLRVKRRVLILVNTKVQGYAIAEFLNGRVGKVSGTQFNPAEFVSTDRDRRIQSRVIASFNEGQEVRVLIGTSLLGEGVDLPGADALVYARGEKAEVSLTQAIYRVCTAISGKREALLVDFADRHHSKLLAHAMARLQIYHKDPIFNITILQHLGQFPLWCDKFRSDSVYAG